MRWIVWPFVFLTFIVVGVWLHAELVSRQSQLLFLKTVNIEQEYRWQCDRMSGEITILKLQKEIQEKENAIQALEVTNARLQMLEFELNMGDYQREIIRLQNRLRKYELPSL